MNERYPHKLIYTSKASEDVYDQTSGKWIVGSPGQEFTQVCRAKPNGAGRKKPNKDGVQTDYSFDIGFPYDSNFNIPDNTEVRILGINDKLLFEGELLGYQIGTRSIIGWI